MRILKTLLLAAALLGLGLFLGLGLGSPGSSQIPISALPLELSSPQDRIAENQIALFPDKVIISIKNAGLARFADTNSMDPVLDVEANALQIVPSSPEQIAPGDIISYETEKGTVIHRVIAVGYDDKGWYAITKGDNNALPDAKVRWSQVKRITVAIIY